MASMTSAFVLNWLSLNWISTSVEYTKAAIWTLPVNKPVLTYTYAHINIITLIHLSIIHMEMAKLNNVSMLCHL